MPIRKKLVIGSLANQGVATFVHALDNQWVPQHRLRQIKASGGKLSRRAMEPELIGLAKYEYRRALLNSKFILLNRASLFNTRAIYDDLLLNDGTVDKAGSNAFSALLRDGMIVPFLFFESSVEELPNGFNLNKRLVQLWQEICKDTEMDALRLSWDEIANRKQVHKVALRFHNFSQQFSVWDPLPLADQLGISIREKPNEFSKLLRLVRDEANHFFDDTAGPVTREHLYRMFVVRDGKDVNVSDGDYDIRKPFALEIKQMLDAVYVSGLPYATAAQVFNASDTFGASGIQYLDSPGLDFIDPVDVVSILRSLVLNQMMNVLAINQDVFDLSQLSLPDVLRLRNTDQWKEYVGHLEKMLQFNGPRQIVALASNPIQFQTVIVNVLTSYLSVLAQIRNAIDSRSFAALQNRRLGGRTGIRFILSISDIDISWIILDPSRGQPIVLYERSEKLDQLFDTPQRFNVKMAQIASPYDESVAALNETTCLSGLIADARESVKGIVADLIKTFPGKRVALAERNDSGPDTVTEG